MNRDSEAPYLEEYGPLLCGIDEAGRGPLCGPVCAAAVILGSETNLDGLNDSKKLSEARREALYEQIITSAYWGVGLAEPEEIDRLNILHATFLAMRRAVESLPVLPSFALVDGNRVGELPCPSICVVKGDALCPSIAAASVLAKVTRDRLMQALDKEYPQYLLAKHKGYPTAEHYRRIFTYGVAPFYRKSFLKNLEQHRTDSNFS